MTKLQKLLKENKLKFTERPKISRQQYKDLQTMKYKGVSIISYQEAGQTCTEFRPFEVFQANAEAVKDELIKLHFGVDDTFLDDFDPELFEEMYKMCEDVDILGAKKAQ